MSVFSRLTESRLWRARWASGPGQRRVRRVPGGYSWRVWPLKPRQSRDKVKTKPTDTSILFRRFFRGLPGMTDENATGTGGMLPELSINPLNRDVMAIFKSGLGEVKGKYGNLITYVVKGQNRVRSMPLAYRDANTVQQQKQRGRLKFACAFYSFTMENALLREVWRLAAIPTPHDRYALFRKVNMNACSADWRVGDYAQLHLAKGVLPRPQQMRFECDGEGNLTITWENHLAYLDSRDDDRLLIAFLREGCHVAEVMEPSGATRRDERAVVHLDRKDGTPLHLYAFFAAPDGSAYSDDTYSRVSFPSSLSSYSW